MITKVNTRKVSVLMVLAVIFIAMLMASSNASATNLDYNYQENSNIIMFDLCWPFFSNGTYYCYWYCNILPKQDGITFYGGTTTYADPDETGMFDTFWGSMESVYWGEEFYSKGYGAEGAQGGVGGSNSIIAENEWYTIVMRTFSPITPNGTGYMGWWVHDIAADTWRTHSVVKFAQEVTGLGLNGGFVEALSPATDPREFHRRLGYCRVGTTWHKADTLSCVDYEGDMWSLIENDTVLRYYRDRADGGTGSGSIDFTTVQPDTPTFDSPAITGQTAKGYGSQVLVQWDIPTTATPQLSYKIEAFDSQGGSLGTYAEAAPYVRKKRVDVSAAAVNVELTVTDIFDQTTSETFAVSADTLDADQSVTRPRIGLEYQYYEDESESWTVLPDFASLTPVRTGVVNTLDDTVRLARNENYGIEYQGYINVPADGFYVFQFGSCDGSELVIDGVTIADIDGIHSNSFKRYTLSLEAGYHSFELSYFNSDDGSYKLKTGRILFSWEGPGFELRDFEHGDFVFNEVATLPVGTMPGGLPAPPAVLSDNLVTIEPVITDLGSSVIDRIEYYYGSLLLDIGTDPDTGYAFDNLIPEGGGSVLARLCYDNEESIDSDLLPLVAQNYNDSPWTIYDFDDIFPLAVRAKDTDINFLGEGFCMAYQAVSGDFTMTGHVDQGLQIEDGVDTGTWWRNRIGLYVQSSLNAPYGSKRFGIYALASGKVKGDNDYPDLGGSHVSNVQFPSDYLWFKIIRRGSRFQAFTSPDGEEGSWVKACERIQSGFSGTIYPSLHFYGEPGKSPGLYNGSINDWSLSTDTPETEPRVQVDPNDLPDANQVIAMTQSPDGTIYARSNGLGVLRSTDAGGTWDTANTGLSEVEELAVRSIAVHPTDSDIILRGSGSVVNGQLESGLFRSTDAGQSWTSVSTAMDFDGNGPTTIFGETIAFCPETPNLVAAAGETTGLYLSEDAGATWTYKNYSGERITSLTFVRVTSNTDLILYVGTFDDAEFNTLGLPAPDSVVNNPGRVYRVTIKADSSISYNKECEVDDFGITNVVAGYNQNWVFFGTTRGFYYTWQHCSPIEQRLYDKSIESMPGDVLYTAVGAGPFDDWTLATYTAPFSSAEQSPIYYTKDRGRQFEMTNDAAVANTGYSLSEGATGIMPDKNSQNIVYLCNKNGIFKSIDQGHSYQHVYMDKDLPKLFLMPVIITGDDFQSTWGSGSYGPDNLVNDPTLSDSSKLAAASSDGVDTNANLDWDGGPAYILYDFGYEVVISNVVIWNYAGASSQWGKSMKDFTVDFSYNGTDFFGETGAFQAAKATSQSAEPGQFFNFADMSARYARIKITSNWGDSSVVGASEIKFNDPLFVPDINPNAPKPNPMTFDTAPYSTGPTSISMFATHATHADGVEYYFTCISGGGNDSGWQDSSTYADTGLTDGVPYVYAVKARDKANQNTTAQSSGSSATPHVQMNPFLSPVIITGDAFQSTWGTGQYGPDNLDNDATLSDSTKLATSINNFGVDTNARMICPATGPFSVDMLFDFGQEELIGDVVIWNYASISSQMGKSMKDFMVDFSNDDVSFFGQTGALQAAKAISQFEEPAQVFEFPDVTARYARITITSKWGSESIVGASEIKFSGSSAAVIEGDINGNNIVDMVDLMIMVNDWLMDDSLADIYPPPAGDGTVNLLDFAVLAENWLEGK